jgi:hypothetical protein
LNFGEWKEKMPPTKVPYGKPAKLLVDVQGYPDGRLVSFLILRKRGSQQEIITEVYGVTRNGKGIGEWHPAFRERKEALPLVKTVTQQTQQEKYFFIANIDDKEAKSPDMEFIYPLDIYLEDTNGKPLEGAECSVTFSNGSKKKAVFKNGHIKFVDAPSGKFKIDLEKCEFVF